MLYNYKLVKAEIKNIELEIKELEREYNGCSAIGYEEKTGPTNKFNSSVENEMMAKRFGPDKLMRKRDILINQIQKIDNALEALTGREHKIINLKYFEKMSNQDIAREMDLTEQWICGRKKQINKCTAYSLTLL